MESNIEKSLILLLQYCKNQQLYKALNIIFQFNKPLPAGGMSWTTSSLPSTHTSVGSRSSSISPSIELWSSCNALLAGNTWRWEEVIK